LRIKKQETRLTLQEHDGNDDVYALSFPLLAVITALTLCPVFIKH